ncbi:unnamed protein product [Calypogeia fissa]
MRGTLWNVKCSVPTTTRISAVDDDEVVLPPVQTVVGSANAGEEVLKAQSGENGREHGEKLWSSCFRGQEGAGQLSQLIAATSSFIKSTRSASFGNSEC